MLQIVSQYCEVLNMIIKENVKLFSSKLIQHSV
jgi:hypothetical protein